MYTGSIPVGASKRLSRLAFDTQGNGEPHGLATTRVIWRRVVPLLRDGRSVVTLDVPGFGASPPAGPGFELDAVADAIADGLSHVETPFDLVGHSLGGAVAIAVADRYPERVRRLVLVAPAGLRRMPDPAARVFGITAERAIPLRRLGAPLADLRWGRRLLCRRARPTPRRSRPPRCGPCCGRPRARPGSAPRRGPPRRPTSRRG